VITIDVDQLQIAKIKDKFEKYPPYAIGKGLDTSAEYLNSPAFKNSMYPGPVRYPFQWSSDKQRRAYFATNGFGHGIPYNRSNNLKNSGEYKVDKSRSSLYVFYQNTAPYAKWVIGQLLQIVGHKATGWKSESGRVLEKRSEIVSKFKEAALRAWQELG
jgi:hypothetical protein